MYCNFQAWIFIFGFFYRLHTSQFSGNIYVHMNSIFHTDTTTKSTVYESLWTQCIPLRLACVSVYHAKHTNRSITTIKPNIYGKKVTGSISLSRRKFTSTTTTSSFSNLFFLFSHSSPLFTSLLSSHLCYCSCSHSYASNQVKLLILMQCLHLIIIVQRTNKHGKK